MASILDGDDATQGYKNDAAVTNPATSASMISLLKGLLTQIGASYVAKVSVTRPANTTAYTAGDVVGATAAVWEFPLIGASGGQIIITGVDHRIDVAAIPAGMSSFRLHLYDATPPSALADNAAWDLPAGDRASYLGFIDIGSPVDMGSTLFVQEDQKNKKVKLNASTSLFGYLVTNGGFTPTLSAVKTLRIHSLGA